MCALLDEVVGPFGARIERRAGDGEDEPAEIGGIARGDERPGAGGRLDYNQTQCNSRNQAVASREIAGAGFPACADRAGAT